jgi:putative NADH-flavin reductase
VKLTIVAATGGIGRQAVEQAVAAGHEVTAVARHPRDFPAGVQAITVDLASPDAAVLASAVAGADAVLSCLGARTKADTGITSKGTRAIVEAMQAQQVRRLVVVSAAPIGTVPSPGRPTPPKHDPGDGFFMRTLLAPMTKRIFASTYVDLALMEDIVRDGGLDWTIVRPPRLLNGPRTGTYRMALGMNLRRGLAISRADVADGMLRVIEQPDTIGQTVGVSK